MVVGAAMLVGAGCGAKPRAAKPARTAGRPEFAQAWRSTPLAVHAEPIVVKEGAAPLVYLVEAGAMIRVRDVSGDRDIARADVPARTIVRVDGRRGVIYGQQTVFAGPLPEGHRYVIFVDPAGDNVARQGTVRPLPQRAR
jgi:hypothetical protein